MLDIADIIYSEVKVENKAISLSMRTVVYYVDDILQNLSEKLVVAGKSFMWDLLTLEECTYTVTE